VRVARVRLLVSGLQLLHALLQAIDAALALRGLARKRLALPLLHHLLALLDDLLMLLRALLDPLSSRQPLARRRRARVQGGVQGRGDMRRRPLCHGRTLRCSRRTVEFGPWCCDVRGSRTRRRRGDVRASGVALWPVAAQAVDGTQARRDAPLPAARRDAPSLVVPRGGPSPVARPLTVHLVRVPGRTRCRSSPSPRH